MAHTVIGDRRPGQTGARRSGVLASSGLPAARLELHVAAAPRVVFDVVRDLSRIPLWWPGALEVSALPSGESGRHARAIVGCGSHALELRVIDYRSPSRLLLALHGRGAPLLAGIDIEPSGGRSRIVLTVSAAGRGGTMGRAFERLRMAQLAWRTGRRLRRLLAQTASGLDRGEGG